MPPSKTPTQVRTERLATIARAVDHLNATDAATLRAQLATTSIHDHRKRDPEGLATLLSTADQPRDTSIFGLWAGAQSVLRAAGLPA
ncbi:hypothetical protein [Streptomyces sp. NBC_00239]|uniref:hypothetical protein n=1 Tax=Streptomyces sp. NBC_00239 TaxID=2903640 RepID=UPI002E2C0E82|nr:hypothetical protein [Streptomyces sp. NBC_00239]